MPKRIIVAATSLLLVMLFVLPLYSAPPTQLTFPSRGTVNTNARIRSGPSTTNTIVGRAVAGQVVSIIGCNVDCSWYQIADTQWIAAFLVDADSATNDDCDPSYPGVCIPPTPPDLDCGDVSASGFQVIGSDPHGFDADDDGIGCEDEGATANSNARLRSGPGATFSPTGRVTVGQTLELTGRNEVGTWYRLSNGAWIRSSLVKNAPGELPIVNTGTPTPTPGPIASNTPTATPTHALTATLTPTPSPTEDCDRSSYPGVCIPHYPPDLDCGDVPFRRFQVTGSDPHGFDGDRDGIGCEGG